MIRKHDFRHLTFSQFFQTRDRGKREISNSQHLACFLLFIHHIHTICSLWTIKATKVQHPTIYNTSRHALPPNNIINLWTQTKKLEKVRSGSKQKVNCQMGPRRKPDALCRSEQRTVLRCLSDGGCSWFNATLIY